MASDGPPELALEKTGGSPRCERASAVSTIRRDNQIPEPPSAHSRGDVQR